MRKWLRKFGRSGGTLGLALAFLGMHPGIQPMPSTGLTDHVAVISIDGLRPDASSKFGARTLQRLMREGVYSLEARTIYPSKTLPSHTSMVTGVSPEAHGITWNEDHVDEHGVVPVSTMFEVAKAEGLHTAAFFSKSKF